MFMRNVLYNGLPKMTIDLYKTNKIIIILCNANYANIRYQFELNSKFRLETSKGSLQLQEIESNN